MEHEDSLGSDMTDGFMSDLTNSIPGIDEAMSFAEMLKYVWCLTSASNYLFFECLYGSSLS